MRVRSSIVLSCLLLTIPLSLPAQRPMTLEDVVRPFYPMDYLRLLISGRIMSKTCFMIPISVLSGFSVLSRRVTLSGELDSLNFFVMRG